MKDEKKDAFKKRLYSFVLRLIRFVENLKKTQTSKIIGNQVLRSGTSVIGNYIEAQAASSKKDYTNYFSHSLKSANESKVWVTLLRDTGNGEADEANWLLEELREIADIFASSIITLRGKRKSF